MLLQKIELKFGNTIKQKNPSNYNLKAFFLLTNLTINSYIKNRAKLVVFKK